MGATGNLHDLVLGFGGVDHRMHPFADGKRAATERTGLACGGRNRLGGWRLGTLVTEEHRGKDQGNDKGQDDGDEDFGHRAMVVRLARWYKRGGFCTMPLMKRPALFVSDLDGTLLQTDGTLSPFTHEALCAFHRDGVPFTVATGRAFSSARRALGGATLGLPLISSDGALISQFHSPEPLFLYAMDLPALQALNNELLGRGFTPMLDIWDGSANFMVTPEIANPVMEWYRGSKVHEEFFRFRYETVNALPSHWQAISLTLLDSPQRLAPLRAEVDRRFGHLFKTDYAVLNEVDGAALWIQHVLARKENALSELGRLLGVEDGNIVVFGDELNDLGMFGREWHAVAVGNARQELKDKAREVIGHHTEDPVPRYVRLRLEKAED